MSGKAYTSFNAAVSSPVTAGNAIIVGVTYGNNNPTITASDETGDTFSTAIQTWDAGHNQGTAILYAFNIAGGATTITLAFGNTVAYLALAVHEYSGIAALDVVAGRVGRGSSSLSTGTATTTAGGDLIFATGVEDTIGHGDTFTPGAGFTRRVDLGNAAAYADEDLVQSAAGPTAATWSLSPASDWIADMAAFKVPGTGVGAAPQISGLSPVSGPQGTSVTIAGTNFGTTQGTSTVAFNGVPAIPTNWSATNIVASVPNGASVTSLLASAGKLAMRSRSPSLPHLQIIYNKARIAI